jgi:aldehyde:ferredoxin oxidoreductase
MRDNTKSQSPRETTQSDRVLCIDLSSGSIVVKQPPEFYMERFIGGPPLAAALLYQALVPGIDPLGPENVLVMVPGALTGAPVPGSDRLSLAAKSPLTGFIGESTLSGPTGESLAKAGFAALVISGSASSPVFLRIDGDSISIKPAGSVWGLTIPQAIDALQAECPGRGFEYLSIGPAGERQVRFASIADRTGRVAGRTGLGAVMGSKNLKALAIRGNKDVHVHDRDGLRSKITDLADRLKRPEVAVYGWAGSVRGVSTMSRLGILPAANFKQSTGDRVYQSLGDGLLQETDQIRHGCVGCPVKCEQRFEKPRAQNRERAVRLEYQSVYALGPLCGINELSDIVEAAALCDELGMDTVSMGATIAWAMESFERGILTAEDTGGLDLRFGNALAVFACIKQTAARSSFGTLLADGSLRAAQSLGHGSESWAMQVKGLEMPGYDPRHHDGLSLGLAVSARGACHNRAGLGLDDEMLLDNVKPDQDVEDTVDREILREDRQALMDALGICKFFHAAFDDLKQESFDLLSLIGGHGGSESEFAHLPGRVAVIRRLTNLREGLVLRDDSLPERFLAGLSEDLDRDGFENQRTHYYRKRGWSDLGEVPSRTLEVLSMGDFSP